MTSFVDPVVVEFLRRTAAAEDDVLSRVRADVARQRLPSITPEAGRTLQVVARLVGASRVLEVGTCLGYSAIWLARGVRAGGRVETLDVDRGRQEQAERYFRDAGVADRVTTIQADAHQHMSKLAASSYDVVFLDADKEGMPAYLDAALRLLRPGGVLAADNVFWQGSAFDDSVRIEGRDEVREFVRRATSRPDLTCTILPLGDGLLLGVKA